MQPEFVEDKLTKINLNEEVINNKIIKEKVYSEEPQSQIDRFHVFDNYLALSYSRSG